ncbi:MAG: S-layer homology domain-containing protein [Firmicutes bacterium]|nr:S-layer homology domain-containing protein [Bacillota bacterium]
MKRASSLLLIAVLLLATTISGFAFSDITETTPGAKEIQALAEKEYLAGYKDGTFRPDGNITRAEFVTMVNKAKGYEPGVVGVYFTDVPETAWYYTFVKAGLQAGYFTGYKDNTFRPQNNITREEVCTMLAQIEELAYTVTEEELAKIEIKDEISAYATTFVKQCIAAGLMDLAEDGTFRAKELATRTDVAVACYRVLEKAGAFEEVTEVPGEEIGGGGGMGGGAVGGDEGIQITAKQEKQLNALVRCLEEKLLDHPDLNAAEKEILQMAHDGIVKFLADRTYDIQTNANSARRKYNRLPSSEQEQFQNIVSNVTFDYGLTTADLIELKDYFF